MRLPSIVKVRLAFTVIILITLVSVELVWQYRPTGWGPETQVTFGSGDSRIVDLTADASGMVRLVWEDARDGSSQAYYKSSKDNGLTWGPDVRLSNLSSHTIEPLPRLASNGKIVLVFFSGGTGSGEHLLYAASMDGSTFAPQKELTNDPGYQTNAAVSIDGSTIHLVWQNYFEGVEHIYYMQSADSGAAWSPELALTASTTGQDRHPAIAALGSNVFVVWTRYDNGEDAVFFTASHDDGMTWLPEVQLSGYEPQAYSIFPSIGTNGTRIDVVWNSGPVFYARSGNAGLAWSSPLPLTNQTRQYLAPKIYTLGSQLQIVTAAISTQGNDVRHISITSDIYYLRSVDGGDSWAEPISLTAHPTDRQSLAPAIAAREDATFVAWEDNRNGPLAIFVRSSPDFAKVQAFLNPIITIVVAMLALTTASYLLLEIRHRSKRLGRARRRARARRRKRLPQRGKGKRRKIR